MDTDYETYYTQFICPVTPGGTCTHPMVAIYARTKRMTEKTMIKALQLIPPQCMNFGGYVGLDIGRDHIYWTAGFYEKVCVLARAKHK